MRQAAQDIVAQISGRFVTARNLGHGQVWFRVARDHRKFVLCDGANSLEAWPTRYVPSWREWMAWESKPALTTKTPATPSAPAKGVPGSRLEEEAKSKSQREHERKKRRKEEGAKRSAPAPTPQAKHRRCRMARCTSLIWQEGRSSRSRRRSCRRSSSSSCRPS